jgi:hypothetical protein
MALFGSQSATGARMPHQPPEPVRAGHSLGLGRLLECAASRWWLAGGSTGKLRAGAEAKELLIQQNRTIYLLQL